MAKKALEEPFAILAYGGTSIRVNSKGVRNLHSAKHHFFHPDGTATPRGNPFTRFWAAALEERRYAACESTELHFRGKAGEKSEVQVGQRVGTESDQIKKANPGQEALRGHFDKINKKKKKKTTRWKSLAKFRKVCMNLYFHRN